MDLSQHYAAMRAAAARQLALGQAELGPLLDTPADTRHGLTVLARLPAPVVAALGPLLALELVFNNWCQRAKHTELLEKFPL